MSRWFSNLRFKLYHLYLCWDAQHNPRRGYTSWQAADKDGEWTHVMTIWEVFKDPFIYVCSIYPDHLSGNPDGCYRCQCKAHDAGWYDMDTGYVTR